MCSVTPACDPWCDPWFWVGIAILVVGWQANRWGVPILPVDSWRPEAVQQPFVWVLMVLTLAVGAPFFLLSTNSTLMQAWFKQDNPEGNPYGLYALSNAGSLVGLLAYPVLVEPNLPLRQQAYYWAVGFVFFVGVAGFQAVRIFLQDGRTLEAWHDIEEVLSPTSNTYEQLVEKFKYNVTYTKLLDDRRAEEMVKAIERLDQLKSIGEFIDEYLVSRTER